MGHKFLNLWFQLNNNYYDDDEEEEEEMEDQGKKCSK